MKFYEGASKVVECINRAKERSEIQEEVICRITGEDPKKSLSLNDNKVLVVFSIHRDITNEEKETLLKIYPKASVSGENITINAINFI